MALRGVVDVLIPRGGAGILADAVEASGFDRAAVSIIETTDRAATGALMALRGVVDVLIPRGGAGLIQRCVRESLVPVIETGTGNCHIYVHESADFAKARAIIMNAKTQRVGVCNACEYRDGHGQLSHLRS